MKLKTNLFGHTYAFSSVKEVLAKANEEKSGDRLAGVAAETAQERVAAKIVLSELPLSVLRENPVVPYEEDEVTRIIQDDVNEKQYPTIYVSAYAIQKEQFETVEEAYAAYNQQWGENGAEYGSGSPFADVTTISKNTVLTNSEGVVILDKENTIDTTESKMGLDVGKIPLDVAYQFEPTMSYEEFMKKQTRQRQKLFTGSDRR